MSEFYDDLMSGFNDILDEIRGKKHLKKDVLTIAPAEFEDAYNLAYQDGIHRGHVIVICRAYKKDMISLDLAVKALKEEHDVTGEADFFEQAKALGFDFKQYQQVIDMFDCEPVTHQICIVAGDRQSGKTDTLSFIANRLEQMSHWTILRLDPSEPDLIGAAANQLQQSSLKVSVDLDVGAPPKLSITTFEELMRSVPKDQKVLMTLDNATDTLPIKKFICDFQILIGQEYPVFLLMAGLNDEIQAISDDDQLTFLYRAPMIRLERKENR